MKYLINQTVCFDAGEGRLNLVNDENNSISLSRPGMRLLTQLVTHSGITLTREALRRSVWEDHGLVPSNSNLSNHISYLRKVFSDLGMPDDIILTTPREGFKLQAEIEEIDHTDIQDIEISDEEKTKSSDNFISKQNPKTSKKSKLKTIFFNQISLKSISNALLLLSLTVLVINTASSDFFINHKNIKNDAIALCHIVNLDHEVSKSDISFVKKLIGEKNIDCINKESTIYLKITDFTPGIEHNQKTVFYSQCFSQENKKNSTCESYLTITIKKP